MGSRGGGNRRKFSQCGWDLGDAGVRKTRPRVSENEPETRPVAPANRAAPVFNGQLRAGWFRPPRATTLPGPAPTDRRAGTGHQRGPGPAVTDPRNQVAERGRPTRTWREGPWGMTGRGRPAWFGDGRGQGGLTRWPTGLRRRAAKARRAPPHGRWAAQTAASDARRTHCSARWPGARVEKATSPVPMVPK